MPTLPDDHLPLGESEQRLIGQWRKEGISYVEKYTRRQDPMPSLKDLDDTFLAWRIEPIVVRPHANDFLNGLSILMADHFFADSPSKWVVIDDKLGARLAVYHEASGYSVNVRDVFAKRMTLEVPWIEEFYLTMRSELAKKSSG